MGPVLSWSLFSAYRYVKVFMVGGKGQIKHYKKDFLESRHSLLQFDASPEIYMNDGVVCGEKWRSIMGNIRPNYIKSMASQLLEEHGDVFSTDFSVNKENVAKYTDIESKVIRNRVAGYIVRKLRVKAIRKK